MSYVSGIKQIKHSLLITEIYGCPAFSGLTWIIRKPDNTECVYRKNCHLSSRSQLVAVLNWSDGGLYFCFD